MVGVGVDGLEWVGVDRGGEGSGGDVVVGWGHRGEGGVGEGSGAGLVGPGVVGEPGGEPLVLAGGAEGLIDVAPPGPGTVHTLTVALTREEGAGDSGDLSPYLDGSVLVLEGEWGALAPEVDVGAGGLGLLQLQGGAAGHGHHHQGDDHLGHVGLLFDCSC